MFRLSYIVTAGVIVAVAGLASAQNKDEKKYEEISFTTVDKMLIKGSFYSSNKGANAPVVMFLHKFGSDRTKGEWDALAVRLKEAGYAVLSFDFRGHGQSTQILEPKTFWSYPANKNYIKKADDSLVPKKNVLKYTDFKTNYIPYLVNDIVAARYDLDNRNDSGQCNTSNIIVIGAEEGASLGFFWMATEHARPAVYQMKNFFQIGAGNQTPASDDLAGAIWLSFAKHTPSGAGNYLTFPFQTFAGAGNNVAPTMRERVPMWFAAGQNDKVGMADADYLYDTVLKADSVKPKLETTFKKPIADINLRGAALLGKKTTDEDIEKYIKKLVEKRPNAAPKKRNAGDTQATYVPLQLFGFQNYP